LSWWCRETNKVELKLQDGGEGIEEVVEELALEMPEEGEDIVTIVECVDNEQEEHFVAVAVSVVDEDRLYIGQQECSDLTKEDNDLREMASDSRLDIEREE
jgi:hypothetical protein